MNEIESELFAAGWVRNPNNTRRLYPTEQGLSPEWYSVGARVLPFELSLEVSSDRLRVFRDHVFGETFTRRCWGDTVTVAVFDSVPAFLEWFGEDGNSRVRPEDGANVLD